MSLGRSETDIGRVVYVGLFCICIFLLWNDKFALGVGCLQLSKQPTHRSIINLMTALKTKVMKKERKKWKQITMECTQCMCGIHSSSFIYVILFVSLRFLTFGGRPHFDSHFTSFIHFRSYSRQFRFVYTFFPLLVFIFFFLLLLFYCY